MKAPHRALRRLGALVGAALVAAAFAAPASAPAAPQTAHLGLPDFAPFDAVLGTNHLSAGVSSKQAGCHPKGLGGFGVPVPANAAFLPGGGTGFFGGTLGFYLYIVKPVGSTTPAPFVCNSVLVNNTAAPPTGFTNVSVLEWEETPGATSYEIYRLRFIGAPTGPQSGARLVETKLKADVCPASNGGPGFAAHRCSYVDENFVLQAQTVGNVFPGNQTQAGSHPDLRVIQKIDNGGANPNTALGDLTTAEEPFTCGSPGTAEACSDPGPAPANEAIRTDLFHFPDGLIANPRATLDAGGNIVKCKRFSAGPGDPSLLGDPDTVGSQDPDEDTCPLASKVGTVQTITRVPNLQTPDLTDTRLSTSFGDIFNAENEGTEAGRLFVVIRPACSAGHPFPLAPSSQADPRTLCGGLVPNSPSNPDPKREVKKEFQAAVANIVPTGADGQYRIDTNIVDEITGGDIENFQQILIHQDPSDPTSPFTEPTDARIPRQVRVILQDLWGFGSTEHTSGAFDNPTHDNPLIDTPFVTLPTSCQTNRMIVDKTAHDDPNTVATSAATEGLFLTENCQNEPFEPGLVSEPDDEDAQDPVGLGTTIAICQDPAQQVDNCPADPDRIVHNSHIMSARALFPKGLVINAAAGNFITREGVRIGDIEGFADELGELGGDIILKRVNADNTFVIQAEIRPKDTPDQVIPITGLVTLDHQTGQISADFDNLPQLPFKALELRIGGNGIPKTLVNQPNNGPAITHVEFIPWCTQVSPPAAGTACDESSSAPFDPAFPFSVDDKYDVVNGISGNTDTRPFTPDVAGKVEPDTANSDGNLTLNITKPEKQQNLKGFNLGLPSGLLANLGALNLCPAAQADTGDCSEANKIGTAQVAAGDGPTADLLKLGGDVFITEPLVAGDVAGMVVKIPAVVGPFNLGNVITKSRLKLDQNRLGVDVETVGAFPVILFGFPVHIRGIELKINGLRNANDCTLRQFNAHFESQGDPISDATKNDTGATHDASAPYAATGCDSLAFNPKVSGVIGTDSEPASVGSHPPVTTTVSQNDHEAAQSTTAVTLPAGLNANLAALATTCSEEQLAADACPDNTKIGSASATSPLIPQPLTGPVFLVANPGGLPKIVVKLSGLINQTLVGTSSLNGGRVVTEFAGLPSTPVTKFVLTVNGGPNGLFTVGNDLCQPQTIDGAFRSHTGQNATDSSVAQYVGNCVPSIARATSRRARLTVRVAGTRRSPTVRIVARKATEGAANLSTLRVTLPSRLVVNTRRLSRGVRVTAGGRRLARNKWTLSRSGVLTVRGLPTQGRSLITVTINNGAVRSSRTLRRLALRRGTLPRLSFGGRVVDVNNARFTYNVRVRPVR